MQRIEDLYDVAPVVIELTGGYFDGHRMLVTDHRDTWYVPIPVQITLGGPEPDPTRPTLDIACYRSTGSVRDDGTRVFRAA